MWKCCNCGKTFEEEDIYEYETTYESYYGVDGEIGGRTPLTLRLCPYCNDEDIEEIEEDEEGDEDDE